ncbi:hypothetical protein CASFOL_035375 [Castilleja foliolosa]|uniref:At1g61320/AtMIF1 LRR domain-containing protein n=1 Tax=Castilleja foliolosa TaxID=1961234 RepID=A0ABD3BTB4_9LAMI
MSGERENEFGNKEEIVVETEDREGEGFVAENEFGKEGEEIYSVQKDGETISNKRMKGMSIDRLSALPDGLLLHILSFLNIDVKKTAVTSVLSKRWQFLWNELPELTFSDYSWDVGKARDLVSWVNRTIILRSGSYLKKFEVSFLYDECYALDVNVWVRFAVKNNVKELTLRLHSGRYFYTLPQVLYSNSSLTCLCLQRCIVATQSKIEWPCLTRLSIEDVKLHDDVIQEILLGCPILRRLELRQCWGFKRLDVNSECLHELLLFDNEDENNIGLLEISAPCLCSLLVSFSPVAKKLQLINVQSLVTVNIHFTECDNSLEVMNTTLELLQKVQHAEELILGGLFVEVLSRSVLRGLRLPQSKHNFLGLETSRDMKSIPGILCLLESSPRIDTLLIESVDSNYEEPFRAWVPAAKNDLECDLLNLKIVRLFDFADPYHAGEPMLTIARTLLKRATTLEKMKIKALGNLTEFASEFTKMSETVHSYPKSSEKAVVALRP